jgi:CheY-like chemotaxis protein
MTKRILVVEDEPLNQKILKGDLSKAGYEVICANHGREGLDILEKDRKFDVIILDRMMPVMDGMETLQALKTNPELYDIPVIMQTAAAATQQVKEGMEAGVFYYLTKPFSREILLTIVENAIRENSDRLRIIHEFSQFKQSLGLMDQSRFRFATLKEAQDLSYLLANACPKPTGVVIGIMELMVNAIEHGNLGITYDEKAELLRTDSWQQEIARRQTSDAHKHKYALVSFERGDEMIELRIEDQGKGFDWQRYQTISPQRAADPNGRGIAMASINFADVTYHGIGNIVTVRIPLRNSSQ